MSLQCVPFLPKPCSPCPDYEALCESTRQGDCASFILFMLRMVQAAVLSTTPQVGASVTALLSEMRLYTPSRRISSSAI
jgi:hypothetical protein